jgi:hypothetical protein
MTEVLKKFSAGLVKDFKEALLKNQAAELIEKVKAAGDTAGSTFKVIVSTSDEDRQGDSLDQSKWNLENYKANPIVLWAHDYYSLPIGVCTNIYVEGDQLIAEGKFTSADLNPFGAQVGSLYEAGFIKTTSVGFIIHEDGTLELLEFSFCPVPANPYALSLREMKKLNLDIPQLVMKGLRFEAKAEAAGDSCAMADGTPGVLADDQDNPGALVCVPADSKAQASTEEKDAVLDAIEAEHTRHGEAVGKAIDEHKGKTIDEFKSAVYGENEKHFQNCMKAIDENYLLEDQKKSFGEFKTAFQNENTEHSSFFYKAIDEFDKNIDAFTKSISSELSRHKDAHVALCKAEMGEGETDEQKALQEKSGRQISAKNKEKIDAAIKTLEDLHEAHGKTTNDVIAALKDLSPGGDEGEEPKDDKKSAESPKPKVEVRDISRTNIDPFEAYMFGRQVLRKVDSEIGLALEHFNKRFKESFPDRR